MRRTRSTCAGRSECSIKRSARTLAVTTDIRASDLHTLAIIVATAFFFAHRTLDPFLPSAYSYIWPCLYNNIIVRAVLCGICNLWCFFSPRERVCAWKVVIMEVLPSTYDCFGCFVSGIFILSVPSYVLSLVPRLLSKSQSSLV